LPERRTAYQYLDLITAAFVAVLLVSNIASTKLLVLGRFEFDGGTILFPLAYIFGDVLTEVYGYGRSRRVIWTGFVILALSAALFTFVDALPPSPAPGWPGQESFHAVLGLVPRIFLGSLLAYFAGEFVNSYLLAKLKLRTHGRFLWLRTISSTVFGQGVDTSVFLLVAFYGLLPNPTLWKVFVSNYVFKVGFEVLSTPLTYAVVNALKRAEREDYYDRDTDFNPFALAR
jgi:uncharacterized integral membrane protein (TIGR00697 family)